MIYELIVDVWGSSGRLRAAVPYFLTRKRHVTKEIEDGCTQAWDLEGPVFPGSVPKEDKKGLNDI